MVNVVVEESDRPLAASAPLDRIFHVCMPKAASQWMRMVLGDPAVLAATGMQPFDYNTEFFGGMDLRPMMLRRMTQTFPEKVIVSPMYLDAVNFLRLPDKGNYRCIFIHRDPRDLVVSDYFSVSRSHPDLGGVNLWRRAMDLMNKEDGLMLRLLAMNNYGIFEAIRSWCQPLPPECLTMRFEDLTGPNAVEEMAKMFAHLAIPLTEEQVATISETYSFKQLSEGRNVGQEDQSSHYRKGQPGDWKNHFTPKVEWMFNYLTNDLVDIAGYRNA